MMLNIIFMVAMYPIIMIVFFVTVALSKKEGNHHFGVYMKDEWMKDDAVQSIMKQYKKQIRLVGIIGAVIPFVTFLVPYVSIQLSIWMAWLYLFLIAMAVPYGIAYKKLRTFKIKMGYATQKAQIQYVETQAAGQTRKVKHVHFAIPILLSLLTGLIAFLYPLLWHRSEEMMGLLSTYRYVIAGIIWLTPLFYGMAVVFDRQSAQVICEDSIVNVNYNRAKKKVWCDFWLKSAWMNTVFCILLLIGIYVSVPTAPVVIWGSVAESILLVIFCVQVVNGLNRITTHYKEYMDERYEVDEEQYWIWGVMYNNPWDKRTMVDKRFGVGTTINLATPIGKGLLVVSVAVLLSIPLLCGWCIFEEFTPIHLRIEKDAVCCEQIKRDYEIAMEDIQELTLMDKEPDIISKEVGTAMDNLNKGRFTIRDSGSAILFYNPKNTKIIKVQTKDKVYYLGGNSDEETMEVFNQLVYDRE